MEYNAQPNIKAPMMIVGLGAALGLLLAITPAFIKNVPPYAFQLPAALIFLVCILLLSRFVLTAYTYQLYDAANTMSSYPKLNIYCIRKSGSRMAYCIPFNNVISVKKKEKNEKKTCRRENLCASMFPEKVYIVRYLCDNKEEEVAIECDEQFANEIEARIEAFSEVR